MKMIMTVIVLSLSISAQAARIDRVAKKLEKKLGLEVTYSSVASDYCSEDQVAQLLSDFKKADKTLRVQAKSLLSGKTLSLDKVTFKGTQKGHVIYLNHLLMVPNSDTFNTIVINQKLVADKRDNLGLLSANEVVTGGDLINMSLNKIENAYTRIFYSTFSQSAFNYIKDEKTLQDMYFTGYLLSRPRIDFPGMNFEKYSCGTISLKELMSKF